MRKSAGRQILITLVSAASLVLACSNTPVLADPGAAPGENTAPAPAAAEMSPASKAFEAAMQKMHQNMMVPYSNDVDLDFVRGMIPHHQGAIDQAEVLLKYSKNPRLRRLAGGIIAAQKREIRFMQNWLKEHDTGVETGDMPEWMKAAPDTEADAAKRGESDKP